MPVPLSSARDKKRKKKGIREGRGWERGQRKESSISNFSEGTYLIWIH